jgi:hypothetical protein
MYALRTLVAFVAAISIAHAHTVITYPGWRGNNLHTNGTVPEHNPSALGIDYSDNGTVSFPWGQQWIYPCKHTKICDDKNNPLTLNHQAAACHNQPTAPNGPSTEAACQSNLDGSQATESAPKNMSHPVVPPFQLVGPNNFEYTGQFCLPQIGMPKNLDLQVGTNITIQVIELAQHGAALYNVRSNLTLMNQPQGYHKNR